MSGYLIKVKSSYNKRLNINNESSTEDLKISNYFKNFHTSVA